MRWIRRPTDSDNIECDRQLLVIHNDESETDELWRHYQRGGVFLYSPVTILQR